MSGPLAGIRVVEMSVAIQAPAAGMYLADMGAEVIKIEPPIGDSNRWHRGTQDNLPEGALSSQFTAMNRGKRSLPIDVHHPLGQKALAGLIASADVFLTNYREDALERMGVDYATLHARHPRLIYASVTGWGRQGPDAAKSMLDGAAQARGGLVSMIGERDGPPTLPGVPLADTAGAMQLALGVMTALFTRERTGTGQRVQTSAIGAQLWLQMWELQHLAMTGTPMWRDGQHHSNMRGPYGLYETADGGWILFAAAMVPEAWDALCVFGGIPEAAIDPEWSTNGRRLGGHGPDDAAVERIRALMRQAFATHDTATWTAFLYEQPEIIWERVRDHTEVLTDPQNIANGYVTEVDQPHIGPTPVIGNWVQFSDSTPPGPRRPPLLGEHADALLAEAGLTDAERETLQAHTAAVREETLAALFGSSN